MNEIGETRFRIQLICDYPCEDKYQLKQKEGEYIRDLGTLNKQIAVEHNNNIMKNIKSITKKLIRNLLKSTKKKIL